MISGLCESFSFQRKRNRRGSAGGGEEFSCCFVSFGNADTPTYCSCISCNDLLHCGFPFPVPLMDLLMIEVLL